MAAPSKVNIQSAQTSVGAIGAQRTNSRTVRPLPDAKKKHEAPTRTAAAGCMANVFMKAESRISASFRTVMDPPMQSSDKDGKTVDLLEKSAASAVRSRSRCQDI